MSCSYCYNHSSQNYILDIKSVENLILSAKKAGTVRVVFSGGEPLLYPNLVQLFDIQALNDMEVMIITNGNMLSYALIDKLISKQFSIQLTLDGSNDQVHGLTRNRENFYKVIEVINYYKQKKKLDLINLRCNISRTNMLDVHKMLDKIYDMGIRHCHLALVEPVGKGKNFIKENSIYDSQTIFELINSINAYNLLHNDFYITLGDQSKCFGCPFLSKDIQTVNIRIRYDGEIFPCQLINEDIYSIGNIKRLDISSKQFEENYNTIISTILQKFEKKKSVCNGCICAHVCKGGCVAIMIDDNNEILNSSCFQKKSYIKEVLTTYDKKQL